MAKTIIHGINEDGTFKTELKTTSMLVTELIRKFPKMCEADIQHALEDIRASAEQDDRIRRYYSQSLKHRKDRISAGDEYVNDHEKELIAGGIDAINRCVKNNDMASLIAISKLCKAIAGDRFSISLQPTYEKTMESSGD